MFTLSTMTLTAVLLGAAYFVFKVSLALDALTKRVEQLEHIAGAPRGREWGDGEGLTRRVHDLEKRLWDMDAAAIGSKVPYPHEY
ncbi:MAG TPA: hypothetical protein VN622_02155 [Clostridia bacterium]|nr:hypothetical protein [Clostridia bacterium]